MSEIRALAQEIRVLRAKDARLNVVEIKALEAKSRAKWEQVRQLRAGPPADIGRAPERRSLYR